MSNANTEPTEVEHMKAEISRLRAEIELLRSGNLTHRSIVYGGSDGRTKRTEHFFYAKGGSPGEMRGGCAGGTGATYDSKWMAAAGGKSGGGSSPAAMYAASPETGSSSMAQSAVKRLYETFFGPLEELKWKPMSDPPRAGASIVYRKAAPGSGFGAGQFYPDTWDRHGREFENTFWIELPPLKGAD